MKTLTKFMIKSFAGPIAMTFFIVTFILMLNFLWLYIDDIVGKGLPTSVILELIFYATSTLIPIGLPLATLLAAIMTMGNLGENNELLALKAAGISLQKIMRPIVYVAILISIGSFFVINNFVPYSYKKMNALLFDVRQQRQQIEFRDGIFFNGIPNISIKVDKQDKLTHLLTGVIIYDNRDSERPNTILADSGYISLSNDKEYMQIKLYNGTTYEESRGEKWYDEYQLRQNQFDYQQLLFTLDGFSFKRSEENEVMGNSANSQNIVDLADDIDSLSLISINKLHEFSDKVSRKYLFNYDTTILNMTDSVRKIRRVEIDQFNYGFDTLDIATKTAILERAKSSLNSLKFYASAEHSGIRVSHANLYSSEISWYKKITLPISIMIFFVIGASLGAIIRKGGLGMPIVISVVFFVIYYILMMTGEKMVMDGAWVAPLGMWFSSIVLGPLAVFLSIKATSDSPLLNSEVYHMRLKKLIEKVEKIVKKYKKYKK